MVYCMESYSIHIEYRANHLIWILVYIILTILKPWGEKEEVIITRVVHLNGTRAKLFWSISILWNIALSVWIWNMGYETFHKVMDRIIGWRVLFSIKKKLLILDESNRIEQAKSSFDSTRIRIYILDSIRLDLASNRIRFDVRKFDRSSTHSTP